MNAFTEAGRLAWRTGSPRIPGCAVPAPWWANRVTWFTAGTPVAVAAGLVTPADAPLVQVLTVLGVPLFVLLAIVLLAEWLDNRRVPWHLHCDDCGVCSIRAGVPGAWTVRDADRIGVAYGWQVDEAQDVTVCPSCQAAELTVLPEVRAA